jgi:membrane-bound lytic murein transglycosylase D
VTTAQLKKWNRLTTASVRRGTRLKVRTEESLRDSAARSAADSAKIAVLEPPRSRKKSSRSVSSEGGTLHRVRSGDTLSGIASRYGVTVGSLRRANGLSTSRIRAGQRLRIPTG